MKTYILLIASLLFSLASVAQDTTTPVEKDTTIYVIAEQAPLFPLCSQLDTTHAAKVRCTQDFLLSFVYKNVQYPMEAREAGLEGTVVTSFVIEPDSTVSNIKILKDIGGNCGAAVEYVIGAMNQLGVRWTPGKIKGKAVRTQMTLPVKFKLEDPLPYVLIESDTIYKQFDTPLNYKGGVDAFTKHLEEHMSYPDTGNVTCAIGYIDVQLLVDAEGIVEIIELLDYNNLGLDFQMEATSVALATSGQWEIATYQGRNVPTSYDLRLDFIPTEASACTQTITDFNAANALAVEGVQLYNEDKIEESILKYSTALALFPNHAEFLASRGQGYMDLQEFQNACADLTLAGQILGVNWYDSLLSVICRMDEEKEEKE